MVSVLKSTWPLLLGVMLLMVGNGIQGPLLGIRGGLEGFSTFEMSIVMSGYFLGFLGGSVLAPKMIQRVGHVRVFAALGSVISSIFLLYAVLPDIWVWTLLRVVIGFCFCGVYVTAESWLNNAASNETRGQALSAYMIVQMLGIIAGQVLLNFSDPAGFMLFILPSVLLSFAFLPILLTAQAAPNFEATRAMGFAKLFRTSPLGCVGMFLTGGIYSAMMGMAAVWGVQKGLSVAQISVFVGAMYVGGLILQYPVGLISDRMDRRRLILTLSTIGAAVMGLAALVDAGLLFNVAVALVLGGMVNPLYALLIAHTNDPLSTEDMAGASAGLLMLNGLGAVFGPILTGWLMERVGPPGFFIFIGALLLVMALYALWRMGRRDVTAEATVTPTMTPLVSALAVETILESAAQGSDAPSSASAPD